MLEFDNRCCLVDSLGLFFAHGVLPPLFNLKLSRMSMFLNYFWNLVVLVSFASDVFIHVVNFTQISCPVYVQFSFVFRSMFHSGNFRRRRLSLRAELSPCNKNTNFSRLVI